KIDWDKSKEYSTEDDNLNIDVAIANSNIEAMSAFVASGSSTSNSPGREQLEYILNAVQAADINKIKDGTGYEIDQLIHQNRFEALPGGFIWEIKPKNEKIKDSISKELRIKLDELNNLKQEYDSKVREIETIRMQIFLDWHKYLIRLRGDEIIDNLTVYEIKKLISDKIKILDSIDLKSLETGIVNKHSEIDHELESDEKFILEKVSGARYFVPKNPVLLISSRDHWDYAGNRNKPDKESEVLQVRFSNEILKETGEGIIIKNDNIPFLEDVNKLISEQILYYKYTTENIISKIGKNEITGLPPEKLSVTVWKKNPWLPLMLQWDVSYRPIDKNIKQITKEALEEIVEKKEIDELW
ncbi:MAG: hypothetical protein GY756_04010, partial [bacterium]|nr:hypothetical protein [bacterium]